MIVNKVRESEPGVGFDAYEEEYVDMVSEGILDPAKVTRSALQNANERCIHAVDNRICCGND